MDKKNEPVLPPPEKCGKPAAQSSPLLHQPPEMRDPLLVPLLLLLLLASSSWADMTVILMPNQIPPNPVPKTTYVSLQAIVNCPDPICLNPPPGSRFHLFASTGVDGGTEVDGFALNTPVNIRYICNSFASCRVDNQPLVLQAKLLDPGNNNVLIESASVPTDTVFTNAPNTPPAAAWHPSNPSVSGNKVTLQTRYNDIDDLPLLLDNVPGVVSAAENGQPSSAYASSDPQWTRSSSASGNSLYQTFTYTCQDNPCIFPIKLNAQGRDPSGAPSIILDFTLNAGGLAPPPPALSITRPAGPICPNSVIRAQATSIGAIKSHEYNWFVNTAQKQLSGVPDGSRGDPVDGITWSDFDCISSGCRPGDSLGVEAVAINSGGQRSVPSSRVIKPLSTDPMLCAPPLPPDVTYAVNLPGPVITAKADQTMPPNVARHIYKWKLVGKDIDDEVPLPSGSTFTRALAPCTAGLCPAGRNIQLTVCAVTAAEVTVCAPPQSILVPAGSGSNPPILTTDPGVPEDTQTFVIKARSTDEVSEHQYNITILTPPPANVFVSQVLDRRWNAADLHNSQISFSCTAAVCRGNIVYINASGRGSSGWSAVAQIAFAPKMPVIAAPEVKSITPDDGTRLRDIQRGVSALIKNTETYIVAMGPPSGQPRNLYDSYKADLLINGRSVAASITKAGNNAVITLSCTPTLCPGGSVIRYQVIGISGGAPSRPAGFALVVPSPSGIPSQLPVLCDQGEIYKWLQIMAIGMGLMIALIAVVYMIGNALHHPQMLDWSKSESANLLVTLLFFLVIAWLVSMQCSLQIGELLRWTGFATYSGNTWASTHPLYADGTLTLSQASLKELEWAIRETYLATSAIRFEMGAGNMRATYSSYSTQLQGMGGNGFSFTPMAGDYTLLGSLGMLLNLNSTFVIALLLQLFSVFFFSASAGLFAFLVPVGLLLRSVPFMRGFGGSMVAIGVGFYLFYPAMLALTGYVLAPLYKGHDASDKLGISSVAQLNEDALAPIGIEGASIASYTPFKPYPGFFKSACVGSYTGTECPVDIVLYFNLTALNFLRAILVPSAGIIVAVAFVRDLSVLFGEEVDASKLIAMI